MPSTILIVDDEPAFRDYLGTLLRTQGFRVVTGADGIDALDQFAQNQPDLVLLDIEMPQMDGFEVCRRLKQNPEARLTPVVLITGLTASEDRIRGIEVGANDFLSKPVDRNELLARVKSLLSLKAYTDELERAESVLFALARSIEGKDPYLEGHCERLASYSARLGKLIGLAPELLTALRRAGIVHDIGKVAVPDAILLKHGELTPEEWRIMREHPVVGERICRPLRSFRLVLPIIRHHHERLDGSGYPDGLRGEQIPVGARILQIADVYDALTTARPYKEPFSMERALEMIEEEVRNGWRDPALFARFREMLLHDEEPEPHMITRPPGVFA
jgi:putative two-component system response regulator